MLKDIAMSLFALAIHARAQAVTPPSSPAAISNCRSTRWVWDQPGLAARILHTDSISPWVSELADAVAFLDDGFGARESDSGCKLPPAASTILTGGA